MQSQLVEIPKTFFTKIQLRNLTGNELKVYLGIKYLTANGKPLQWPSTVYLRQLSGTSRAGFYRATKGLRRKGIAAIQGKGQNRVYLLASGL